MTAPHVKAVMARYGVTTERALNRAVREDYARETGTRVGVVEADIIIDRMYEAEYQRQESGGSQPITPDEVEVRPQPQPVRADDPDLAYERWLEDQGAE